MLKDGLGAENTHITDHRGEVDRVEKGGAGRQGNIHMTLKIEMTIVEGPIREGGAREERETIL